MILQLRNFSLRSVFLLAICTVTGCQMTQPGSASSAHVVIKGSDQDRIQHELIRVFENEDYALEQNDPGHLVFSRPATQADLLLYGDFTNNDMVMRVEVKIESYRTDQHLVLANVYVVKNGMVDRRLFPIGSGHYKSLLKQARASLVSSAD